MLKDAKVTLILTKRNKQLQFLLRIFQPNQYRIILRRIQTMAIRRREMLVGTAAAIGIASSDLVFGQQSTKAKNAPDSITETERQTQIAGRSDVLVCGGGTCRSQRSNFCRAVQVLPFKSWNATDALVAFGPAVCCRTSLMLTNLASTQNSFGVSTRQTINMDISRSDQVHGCRICTM